MRDSEIVDKKNNARLIQRAGLTFITKYAKLNTPKRKLKKGG